MNYHNDDNAPMTGIDNSADAGNMNSAAGTPTVISLDRFSDGDYITKTGMAEVFECSDRTIQRMVERFEIPPPSTVAGRKVWRAGKLKAWLAQADDRAEVEALKEVRRLILIQFDNFRRKLTCVIPIFIGRYAHVYKTCSSRIAFTRA